ncbi:MAG: hypothetical protein ACI80P_000997 [Flavobacteriales bacterium]|jgi:hypothetical protein
MKNLLILVCFLSAIMSGNAQGDSTNVFIYGCTDSLAVNFNWLAEINDGSCIYDWGDSTKFVYGCTDSLAVNFNWLAEINDGSCIYDMGIENGELLEMLIVYPVPFSTTLNLTFERAVSDQLLISIYDISGRLVYNDQWTSMSETTKTIDATHLRQGVYVLQVSGRFFQFSQQLIKQ